MASKMTPKSVSKFDRFSGGSVTVDPAQFRDPGVPQGYHFMVSKIEDSSKEPKVRGNREQRISYPGPDTPWARGPANFCDF